MRTSSVIVALVTVWFAGCSAPQGFHNGSANLQTNASSKYGKYDRDFIDAVSHRWYDLLDTIVASRDYGSGTVVLEFKLHANGRITDMDVKTNSVSKELETLCQKAVLDPSPYEPWSQEMRSMVGEDYRLITFSFFYK